ncbi:cuticle protein AM1159-like [Procambarus clarkii]|uniref:cuticle protein AM1159-like n=1 Tax=Procambarus clarkii TaxID=6728 RepID=UPI003743A0CD
MMKFVILAAAVCAVAFGAPRASHLAASETSVPSDHNTTVVPILEDERTNDNNGTFTVNVKTGNGITMSRSGSPSGTNGSVVQTGEFSYTAPDGTPVTVKFVADENGFQPQSNMMPVAPAFPHPIAQFVLDQIAFAAKEDAARSLALADAVFEDPASLF